MYLLVVGITNVYVYKWWKTIQCGQSHGIIRIQPIVVASNLNWRSYLVQCDGGFSSTWRQLIEQNYSPNPSPPGPHPSLIEQQFISNRIHTPLKTIKYSKSKFASSNGSFQFICQNPAHAHYCLPVDLQNMNALCLLYEIRNTRALCLLYDFQRGYDCYKHSRRETVRWIVCYCRVISITKILHTATYAETVTCKEKKSWWHKMQNYYYIGHLKTVQTVMQHFWL